MIEVWQEIILRRPDEDFISTRLTFPANRLRDRLNEGMEEHEAVIRCACEAAPEGHHLHGTGYSFDSLGLVWYWRPTLFEIRCCIRWPRPAPAMNLTGIGAVVEITPSHWSDAERMPPQEIYLNVNRVLARMNANPDWVERQAVLEEFDAQEPNEGRPHTILRYARVLNAYVVQWVLDVSVSATQPVLSPINTWVELDFADGRELRSFFVASSRVIIRMQQNPSMSEMQAIFQEFEPIDNHRRPSTIVRYRREENGIRYRIEWVLAEEEQPAQNVDIIVWESLVSLQFVREEYDHEIREDRLSREQTNEYSPLWRFFQTYVSSMPGYLRMASWRYSSPNQTFTIRWQCDSIRARQPVAPDLDALRLQRNAEVRQRLDLPQIDVRRLMDAGRDLGLPVEIDDDWNPHESVDAAKSKVTTKPPAPAIKQKQVKRNTSGLRRARPDIIADAVPDEEDL